VLITGAIMGGGPCAWAVEDHLRAGFQLYATPDAARTFNDDLEQVQREMGVTIVDDGEARSLAKRDGIIRVQFRDFDYTAIQGAFAAFGAPLAPDALALAVFDHGAAPPEVSDRRFVWTIGGLSARDRRLSAFAAMARTPLLTASGRLVTRARQSGLPVMMAMPAAVLGRGPAVARSPWANINVGNFHTLAFQFRNGQFVRLLEHHTGLLTAETPAGWRCVRWRAGRLTTSLASPTMGTALALMARPSRSSSWRWSGRAGPCCGTPDYPPTSPCLMATRCSAGALGYFARAPMSCLSGATRSRDLWRPTQTDRSGELCFRCDLAGRQACEGPLKLREG
jgi:hypothetical protein